VRRGISARLVAAAAAVVLAACSTGAGSRRGSDGGAAQAVRIWVAPILWWEEGAAREVDLAIENATNRTVAIAAPDAAHARVAVFATGPESLRVCGVEPREPAGAPGRRVELAPGDRVAVRVSLAEACGAVAPGAYRYEVSYRAPSLGPAAAPEPGAEAAETSARAFSGTLATTYGQIFVAAGRGAAQGSAPGR
jgi:hypothetical protein